MSELEFEKEKEQDQDQAVGYGSRLEHDDPKEPEETPIETPASDEEGDEQLALFDVPKPKEEPAKEKKKAKVKVKTKAEQKVNTDFTVYYAGHRIPVAQDDMTLDEVRAFLEGDFPELSKERTEMIVDEKEKQIVPVVKGAKKG